MNTAAVASLWQRVVSSGAFLDDATLFTCGDCGIRRWDLARGTHELVFAAQYGLSMRLDTQGRTALVRQYGAEGPGPSALGMVLSLLGSIAVSRLMALLLHGVSATDPTTVVLTAALLLAPSPALAGHCRPFARRGRLPRSARNRPVTIARSPAAMGPSAS